MLIGDNIRKFREAAGLSKTELAEKCGLSRNSIYKYEKNEMIPKIEQLRKISIALGVPLSSLNDNSAIECTTINLLSGLEAMRKELNEPPYFTYEDFKKSLSQTESEIKKELNIPDGIIIEIPSFVDADFAFCQNDDSMKAIGINSGDIVFAKVPNDVEYNSGDVVLISIDNKIKVRRVFFENNAEYYVPETTESELYIAKNKAMKDKVDYWGKVVAILKQLE